MKEIILKTLIIITTISGWIYFIDKNLYFFLIKEDGIFESITALTMLLMSVLITYRLFKNIGKTKKWFAFNIFLALICFFGFGEEISWGQRIFLIETNEFFHKYNLQGETNIHNLKIYGVKLNKLIFSTGITIVASIYFLLSHFLYKKYQIVKNQVDQFGIQIPKLEHTIFLIISTVLIIFLPDIRRWELWETVFVLIFFLVLIDPFNEKEKLLPTKNKRH